MRKTQGGLISSVAAGSLALTAGLQPGDRLLAINGQPLRDIVDYRYYSAEENLELLVEREGSQFSRNIERSYESDLGLEFTELVFDGLRLCRNRCPFCFVDQMPKGLRPTLYLHDDDYRYSFLLGNYITLTNLSEDDWQRIGEQGLSPLYVSIHVTDNTVRRRLLGNTRAPNIITQLNRLNELGITVHGQVVIWPGVNDGEVLRQTIEQVGALWPCVETLALVPVGLTCHQRAELRGVSSAEAATILDLADELREKQRPAHGCTWLFPADELYLLAGRSLPPASFYDDDAQWQNGVGMVRDLLDDWQRIKRRLKGMTARHHSITLACGELIAPTLAKIAHELATQLGVTIQVIPVANRLFGASVTVSGLLSGADILAALAPINLGEYLFLPQIMFTSDSGITLDNKSLADLTLELKVPITGVSMMSEIVHTIAERKS